MAFVVRGEVHDLDKQQIPLVELFIYFIPLFLFSVR